MNTFPVLYFINTSAKCLITELKFSPSKIAPKVAFSGTLATNLSLKKQGVIVLGEVGRSKTDLLTFEIIQIWHVSLLSYNTLSILPAHVSRAVLTVERSVTSFYPILDCKAVLNCLLMLLKLSVFCVLSIQTTDVCANN